MLTKWLQWAILILTLGLSVIIGEGCFSWSQPKVYRETEFTRWQTESFEEYYQRETFIYHRPELALTAKQEQILKQLKREEWQQLQTMIREEKAGRLTQAEVIKQRVKEKERSRQRFKPYLSAVQLATLKSFGYEIK